MCKFRIMQVGLITVKKKRSELSWWITTEHEPKV